MTVTPPDHSIADLHILDMERVHTGSQGNRRNVVRSTKYVKETTSSEDIWQ